MKPRPLPDALLVAPFSVGQAQATGVDRARLRAADLLAPHRAVRATEAPASLRGRCLELLPVMRGRQLFSHVTAVALWGLPLPPRTLRTDIPLHVIGVGRREPRRREIVGHRTEAASGWLVDGIPVVEPLTAWAQCAELTGAERIGLDHLVAMADALLASWSPWSLAQNLESGDLEACVRGRNGCRGVVLLREALELARPGVKSPQETKLRLVLGRAGLPEPEINAEVRDENDRWLGIADLVYRDAKVVVEYEGDGHRVDRAQFASDVERGERFADSTWRAVRVTGEALHGREAEVVARVRRLVLARSR